ncbi:MAG: hypothetical protein INR70_14235 [Parafilimonas terrae]|nr:hypothetical protein [Parafilimonas terrae]
MRIPLDGYPNDEEEEEIEIRPAPQPPVTVHGLTGAARRARRLALGRERQARLRERQREAGRPIDLAVDRAVSYAVRKQALDPESPLGKAIVKAAAVKLIELSKRAVDLGGQPLDDREIVMAICARIFRASVTSASGTDEEARCEA